MNRDGKTTCHICLSGALVPIRLIKGYRVDKQYTLYRCIICKSRSFNLNEHKDIDLQAFYDFISKDEGYLKQHFTFSRYWQNEVKRIQNIYGLSPKSVLDIGCRTGD